MILSLLVLVIVIIGVLILRIDFSKVDRVNYSNLISYALGSVTSYISGEIVALDKYLSTFRDYSYGKVLFQNIIKWFVRLGIYDESTLVSYYFNFVKVSKLHQVNTFTYIRPLFEDFGLPGIFFIPYMLGIISGFFYKKIFKKFSFKLLCINTYIFFTIVMSFYNFALINIFNLVLLLMIMVLLDKYLIIRTYEKS